MNDLFLFGRVLARFRRWRMLRFLATFQPNQSCRILDIGGTSYNWKMIGYKFPVTLVNLNLPAPSAEEEGDFVHEIGDALSLPYHDNSFDIAYSNSVIEHVGDYQAQAMFALEARRIAPNLWIQTPARSFFIEPHYIGLFVHWLPKRWQRRLIRNFTFRGLMERPSQKWVDREVDTIRLLTWKEMKSLFPDCEIRKEKVLGFTKSYIAVRRSGEPGW